jgi:hypothetical protein
VRTLALFLQIIPSKRVFFVAPTVKAATQLPMFRKTRIKNNISALAEICHQSPTNKTQHLRRRACNKKIHFAAILHQPRPL